MEEAKAAAYYDELTRKGEGAARFKQGLGFSSSTTTIDSNDVVPARGSALPSSSSFLSNFVRASSPSNTSQFQKQSQLQTIHNKLNNPNSSKPSSENHFSTSRVSHDRTRDGHKSDVERESRERHSRRRRSRSRSRDGLGSRHSYRDRDKDRYRERDREGRRRRRSSSPRGGRRLETEKGASKVVDYARLIEGYDKMSPAERVKAKMKFQLSETAEKDATKGMGSGWERFEFNKDAPLDDEEIEAAEDDEVLVKHIGQSFRFSAVEAKREEEIKSAHDEAMFGGSSIRPPVNTDDEVEEDNDKKVSSEVAAVTGLVSDKVLGMQRGSWRDRARKL